MATQITDPKTLNEISRLANILTELDFAGFVNETYGSGLTSTQVDVLDKILRSYVHEIHQREFEFYYEFFANKAGHRYFSYVEADNLQHWIINNVRNILEYFSYDEIFGKYSSLSADVSLDFELPITYWNTKLKARKRFGRMVKKIRLAKQYKQDWLGLTQSQISNLENGEANITLDNLLTISRMLDMELKFV